MRNIFSFEVGDKLKVVPGAECSQIWSCSDDKEKACVIQVNCCVSVESFGTIPRSPWQIDIL